MGYYMIQVDSHFHIDANKIPAVIAAIHTLGNKNEYSNFAWVNNEFVNSNDIVEVFGFWRWDISLNDKGDVSYIAFNGEKLGDDFVLFKTIAPFVRAGSYIEMRGEETDMWRWYFDGETCVEKTPTISWS